jgi:hypothetical protein
MNELENIQNKIYFIRGQRVMLDFDLANIYEVETKALNQAVKRNYKRFEGDEFMFQLTQEEWRTFKVDFLNIIMLIMKMLQICGHILLPQITSRNSVSYPMLLQK